MPEPFSATQRLADSPDQVCGEQSRILAGVTAPFQLIFFHRSRQRSQRVAAALTRRSDGDIGTQWHVGSSPHGAVGVGLIGG